MLVSLLAAVRSSAPASAHDAALMGTLTGALPVDWAADHSLIDRDGPYLLCPVRGRMTASEDDETPLTADLAKEYAEQDLASALAGSGWQVAWVHAQEA